MSFAEDEDFIRIAEAFLAECRRIEPYQWRKGLRKSQRVVNDLKTDIVRAFNAIVSYLIPIYGNANLNRRLDCTDAIQPAIDKIKSVFDILDLQYDWQENPIERIDIALVVPTDQAVHEPEVDEQDDNNAAQDDNIIPPALPNIDQNQNNLPDPNLINEQDNQEIMAQTRPEFLKMASPIMNYKYDGDPLKLDSFLADVALIDDLAEEQNKAFCRTFVKRCLTGRALECIPEATPTMDTITDALKAYCKPESTDVIAGKMMALTVRKGNYTEFIERAEKLAEAFRRGLVFDGTPKELAQKQTIQKTKDLCRKIARADTVKSVVESTTYENPSQVLSKFVTQVDVANKEKKEADANRAIQQNRNNSRGNNGRGRSNGRGNGRGGYQNNGNRYNNYGNNSNNNNHGYQNQNQNRQNNNGNHNNNYRGNGNGNYRGNRGNYRNQNEHTIRFVSGNQSGPNHGQQQNPQMDQVFHVPFQ